MKLTRIITYLFLTLYSSLCIAQVDEVGKNKFELNINGNTLKIPYYSSVNSIDQRNTSIQKVVISLHGSDRNADDYYDRMLTAAEIEGVDLNKTLIIAPQFLQEEDIEARSLDSEHLYWSRQGWRIGFLSKDDSSFPRPARISSYAVMDDLLIRCTENYPNLKSIVISGHSAGGQFVNRYSASTRIVNTLKALDVGIRFIANNPGSYVYLDNKRLVSGTTDRFAVPNTSCTEFNEYRYGLEDLPSYLRAVGVDKIREQLKEREVVYLLGEEDTNTSIDQACPAKFQGRFRLERGIIYFNYLKSFYGSEITKNQIMAIVPGVNHSSRKMFQSELGRFYTFRKPVTNANPDEEGPTSPAGLTVTNITETTADLSWSVSTDNVEVTGYDIYQDGVLIATSTATSYNAIDLRAQTTYVFEVVAKDGAGNESLPATATITTIGTSSGGTTVLHEGFFENGLEGWIDGGSDCKRYSGSRSFEGNYSIRIRDNSGSGSSMTLENVDVSSYDSVDVEFHFYSYSMENGEDFWLRYHDGDRWITVATYVKGTDFENNNFYSTTVTLDKASYHFANNARFRFQNDASANSDQIYIDQVSIKGITNGASVKQTITDREDVNDVRYIRSLLNDVASASEEDFVIFTNPVTDNVLQVEFYGEGTPKFRVINILGQTIKTGNLREKSIDVYNLKTGIYILELHDGEETMSKKFIKN